MKIWLTLYGYELRKLLQKKFTVFALLGIYAFILFGLCMARLGTACLNGIPYLSNAEMAEIDIANARALSGRPVDGALLAQTLAAYRECDERETALGTSPTPEQGQMLTAFQMRTSRPYKAIFDYCKKALDLTDAALLAWDADESGFYGDLQKRIAGQFDMYRLSADETGYWTQKQQSIGQPVVFEYCSGYINLLSSVYAISALLMLLGGISLAGIFSEERALRCDQLILCSKNGRERLFYAKLAAGLTFMAAATGGLLLVSACVALCLYGGDGFGAALQLYRPLYPYPVEIGLFTVIGFALVMIAILTVSMMIMFLSLCVRRSIISMAAVVAVVMMGMFINVPKSFGLASRVWDWLPTNYLFAGNLYDLRLLSIFGKQFVSWQVLPAVYLLLCAGLALAGNAVYKRCQCGSGQ